MSGNFTCFTRLNNELRFDSGLKPVGLVGEGVLRVLSLDLKGLHCKANDLGGCVLQESSDLSVVRARLVVLEDVDRRLVWVGGLSEAERSLLSF